MLKEEKKKRFFLIVLFVFLIVISLANLRFGAVDLSLNEIFNSFIDKESINYQIIVNVRLPRIIMGILAGAALSVSGTILQAIMNNPLASPNIIGVSSGAGFVAMLIMILFPKHYNFIPLGAFLGALFATLIIYSLSLKKGPSTTRIILAGVAVNTIFGAGNDILISLFPNRVPAALGFMVGGLSGISWKDVSMVSVYIILALLLAIFLSGKLNILVLGDEIASSLGENVGVIRLVFIALSSLLAGSAVAVVGLLGFVGLIVPHIMRLLIGSDNKYLIPSSMLAGSFIVLFSDLIARLIFAPSEIPVGVIMSIIGGPFFLYLVFRKDKI